MEFEPVLALDGFAEKKTENLLLAIDASKTRPLSAFVFALGIRHVGEHVAGLLAEAFPGVELLRGASEDQLNEVHGVGTEVASAVAAYFEEAQSVEIFEALLEAGVSPRVAEAAQASEILAGKAVVVTGTLTTMSREEMHGLIKTHGGRAVSSVSKKTDLLVAGEKAGSKLTKAEKLGVAVVSEEAFYKLIGSS